MTIYQPGTLDDIDLLRWYERMAADGSIKTALGASLWPLSAFISHFSNPEVCVFVLSDDDGWWAVTWVAPVMAGWSCGFWIRDDVRGTKGPRHDEAMGLMMDSLALSLQQRPLMLSITTQPHVAAIVERAGFTHLGRVPLLFDGQDCDIHYITREVFAPRYAEWSTRHG